MIQLLQIHRCLILIKCRVYLKQQPHFYNLNKLQSVQRIKFMGNFVWIRKVTGVHVSIPFQNSLYILIGEKSCQTVTTRVPILKGKIQLFTLKYKNKQQNRRGFQNRLTNDTFSMDCGPNPWQSDCRHLNDPNCSGFLRG